MASTTSCGSQGWHGLTLLAVAQMYTNRFPTGHLCFAVVCGMCLALLGELIYKFAWQSVWVGYIGQLAIFVGVIYFTLETSLAVPNEVLQHRFFLSGSLPLLWGSCFFVICLKKIFAFTHCPIFALAWLWFHRSAGFLTVPCVLYGVLSCMALICSHHLVNKFRWEHVQTTCALERALEHSNTQRELVIATQNTLHRMLSSLWDASCTSNTHGTISSSTPHLEQLLGVAGDLAGSNLCAFAANEFDAHRLQEFLRNAASAADQQALSLQCTLRPQSDASWQKDGACSLKTYDVSLYGIKLPRMATSSSRSSCSDECRDELFIGIRAGAPEAAIGETCGHVFTDDFNASTEPGTFSGTQDTSNMSAEASDDVVIVLHGGNEHHPFMRDDGGRWQCLPSSTSIVRLSDFCALPRDNAGQRTSFGSLAHLLGNQGCHRCLFHMKIGSGCREGGLCFLCHADHAPVQRSLRRRHPLE